MKPKKDVGKIVGVYHWAIAEVDCNILIKN